MSNKNNAGEQEATTEFGKRLAGKYLTFRLAQEEYGLEILKVQEIIQMQRITRIPRAPQYVRGVINLRGRVVPVIDLRAKFGMERIEDTDKTCIVVAQIEAASRGVTMGLIIDEVREVVDIPAGDIQEPPSFESSIDTAFIMGIGKTGESVKILLSIDRILSTREIESVDSAATSTQAAASKPPAASS